MERSKQSRRFACDRCRTYKLRCERVSTEGNDCRRCTKFGIFCETTNAPDGANKTNKSRRRLTPSSFSERAMMSPPCSIRAQSTTEPNQRIAPSTTTVPQSNSVLDFDPGVMNAGGNDCSGDLMLSDFDFIDMMDSRDSPRPYDDTAGSVAASTLGDLPDPTATTASTVECRDGRRGSSGYRDLFELSANLVDDTEQLDQHPARQRISVGSSFLETTTQRALSRTSEMLEILKKIAAEEEEKRTEDRGSDSATSHYTGSPPRHQDILIAPTLVTSYLLIVRYWQKLFLHISQLPYSESGGPTNALPILPTLLFGGVQVRANSDIQFMILLETCSSMIQLIEAYLGVASSCAMRFSEGVAEAKTPVLIDPISVSIRETMLSHEALHNTRRDNAPSLKEVMKSMREQIFRRRQI